MIFRFCLFVLISDGELQIPKFNQTENGRHSDSDVANQLV